MYSHIDLRFKISAPLCGKPTRKMKRTKRIFRILTSASKIVLFGKSTGKWHKPNWLYIYRSQIRKIALSKWENDRNMRRTKRCIPILISVSKNRPPFFWNRQENNTNFRRNSCTDLNVVKMFMNLRINKIKSIRNITRTKQSFQILTENKKVRTPPSLGNRQENDP